MVEIELKLQVPPQALPALERALAAPSKLSPTTRTRLRAIYFDTPDRRLASAGVALRLRKEGRRWVQTAKAGPAHGMERAEHNAVVPIAAGLQPALDLQRHAGTPVGEALAKALGTDAAAAALRGHAAAAALRGHAAASALRGHAAEAPLRPHAAEVPLRTHAAEVPLRPHAAEVPLRLAYTTDIWRRHRPQRLRLGVVELALDRGEIRATAPDGIERSWPVCELEVELMSGSPRAVIEAARRLADKHGLWLDVRTKAERGERLARGVVSVPAVKAKPLKLRRSMAPREAWAAVLRNVVAQALPNWSEVASTDGAGRAEPEHVHQLRVALRRLRSAERFFAGWPGIAEPAWSAGVAELFRLLGVARDRDMLAGGVQREIDAELAAIEQPALRLPAGDAGALDPATLHGPGRSLIDLLADAALAETPGTEPMAEPPAEPGQAEEKAEAKSKDRAEAKAESAKSTEGSLASHAAERLAKWHAQVRRDARRFDTLDDEARHRLRKRLKRLRYATEFSGSLFSQRAVERFLDPLRTAQERLGEFNDISVAQAAYRQQVATEPRAWFALGWLARRRVEVLAGCARDLKVLRKAEPFWIK